MLPGGGWLLFDSNQNGNQDLFIQSLSSRRATQISADPGDDFGPVWSPNGKEVAFYGIRDGVRHVFVMRATGQEVRQVTSDSLQDHQPQWAPDGERLVFYREDGAGQRRLYTVARRPDSTWDEPRMVLDTFATGVTWSPDGRWLAYTDREGRLYRVAPEGGVPELLASPDQFGGAALRRPQWHPYEPWLLVRAERPGGLGGIWLLDPEGGVAPREVARFDDPARPVLRDDFVTDGERVYFTIGLFQGSLWMLDLARPG